ncbi:phytanoyl-CoA dioxygenase family protein [Nostoc sp. UHCC 0302]|uniref:phytanoyl-CoA dioxygenase family protein n=1 Tax=Nostoc sp. UHCC 0302 TaxID=3134896 RepID=UPI00311CC416
MTDTTIVQRRDIDTIPKKSLNLDKSLIPQAENIDFWRKLNPDLTISDKALQWESVHSAIEPIYLDEYALQLKEEGYFQTPPVIPPTTTQQMIQCIEKVKKAGFPPIFALVYDIFYEGFAYFDSVLTRILGSGYKLIPNFWIYYIETLDTGKGFEPHRDTEYSNTIGSDGMPNVLTLWISITEATPLNSCMYLVPANRDPEYTNAIHDLNTGGTQFALEDIRALPTPPGALLSWNQYIFHWGSRSSKRAKFPRVSYAVYCQRGDIAPVDDVLLDIPSVLDFETRLAIACRAIYHYSPVSLQQSSQEEELLEFVKRNKAKLQII